MSFNTFKTALHNSFKQQKDCDVTFSCSDPTSPTGESTIMAHKFILSLASEVFYTMFYGEAAKHVKVEEQSLDKINIDDIQMPIFKLFLSFIYNILVDIETTEIAEEFYYAAHKYNATDALEFIKIYMLKEAKPENAIPFYVIACLYENQGLKETCVKIFSENTVDILNSPTFLKADPNLIEVIYKLNKLNIDSEAQLIKALECYIDHNKVDNSDIVEKVRPALSHIRFLTLTAPLIAQTTLLNSEDSLAVTGCLSSEVEICKMPKFLSQNNQKRAFTRSIMQMILKLSKVYTEEYCYNCSGGRNSCSHAYWNCSNSSSSAKLRSIYQKYKHVWLLDYSLEDLKAVYQIYKDLGRITDCNIYQ